MEGCLKLKVKVNKKATRIITLSCGVVLVANRKETLCRFSSLLYPWRGYTKDPKAGVKRYI